MKQLLQQIESNSYTGTGAVVDVFLGFKPSMVFLYNETDGDVCWFGVRGLAADKALQIDSAVSLLSSNGITLKADGFSVGTSLSESGKVIRYFVL